MTPEMLPDSEFWRALGDFLAVATGGKQGAFAVVFAVVQLCMVMLKTAYGEKMAGIYRLLILAVLTVVAETMAGIAAGKSFAQIISSAALLTAVQVLVHQVMKQWTENQAKKKLAEANANGTHSSGAA